VEIWPMEQVKNLGTTALAERVILADILPAIQQEIDACLPMYSLLMRSMEEHGQQVPVRVTSDKLRLRDGHHRIAIADLLGWDNMLVSTSQTAWHEWDETEQGQLYMNMWRQRLGYFRR
jgi:hypothetical protein